MNFFELNFSSTPKVGLVGREHLVPPRRHTTRRTDEHIIYFILTGELNLLINGEPLKLLPGELHIFEKGTLQQPSEADECEYYYLHFTDDNLISYILEASDYEADLKARNLNYTKSSIYGFERADYLNAVLPANMHFNDEAFFLSEEKLKRLNREFHCNEFESRMNLPYFFADFILFCECVAENSFLKKKSNNHSGFLIVKEIADFINENYYLDIGKALVEEKFMFNYDYINRVFKKMMGQSIVKYRNKVRIDNAKNLLKTTELTVLEISEKVGFEDKYYFIHAFTKRVGISPLQFREREKLYAL